MKLKKVIAICNKAKVFRLLDKIDSAGVITQWLGDGCAIYPLNGIPVLDEETLCTVFDISGKQLRNTSVLRMPMPEELNVGDTDEEEQVLQDDDFSVIFDGAEIKTLKKQTGIIFIQKKYVAPLEDMIDEVRFYERIRPDGQAYVVAKVGLLVEAVIMPVAIHEKLVERLEEAAKESRRALNKTSADSVMGMDK